MAAAAVAAYPLAVTAQGVQLGDAVRRFEPQDTSNWDRRPKPKAGLTRALVVQLYNNSYVPGDMVPLIWTGAIATCAPGTTDLTHQNAVLGRINYFRGLVDLPPVTLLTEPQTAQSQAAALMYSANNALSHSPPSNWLCYSTVGAIGAANSNIALGVNGVQAVDLYVDDPGSGNTAAGHRRWILFPPRGSMATGDAAQNGANQPANALYVFGPTTTRPATPAGIAWPPAGFVPYRNLPGNSNRWSYSYPGADFAGASVTMIGPAGPIPVTVEPVDVGYGDNTIVFRPTNVPYTKPSADTGYTIAISGIGGSAPASVQYTVIVIDPDPAPAPIGGIGTTIVFPIVAQTSSFTSEVTLYNPGDANLSATVTFYEALNSSSPGATTCAPINVAANRSAQFSVGSQCNLPTGPHFGLLAVRDTAPAPGHPFYGYSRTQNPQGIGFSIEGFPVGSLNNGSHVIGLKKQAAPPAYQTNCFVGALEQPVSFELRLVSDGTGAQIGETLGGYLAAFEQYRYLDIFGPAGVNAPAGDYVNVRAEFTNTMGGTAKLVAFCTVQDNSSFGADFRIAK